MTASIGISSGMSRNEMLPDAYCPKCEVAWLRGSSLVCWLCGGEPAKPPVAVTEEEKADLLVTRLKQGLAGKR